MTAVEARQLERILEELKRATVEKKRIQLTYRGQSYQKTV